MNAGDPLRSDSPEPDRIESDRLCEQCSGSMAGRRTDARFCSDACRNSAGRAARRVVRDHARSVSAGLSDLAGVVAEVETSSTIVDGDAVKAAVRANLAAVLNAPTERSVHAHLLRIESDYRNALAAEQISHEEARTKLHEVGLERDRLVAELDSTNAELERVCADLQRLQSVDDIAAQLNSMKLVVDRLASSGEHLRRRAARSVTTGYTRGRLRVVSL
ncbi:hypothetical protein [Gordonia sp. QH-12]|uniref:hypothetical protein n=1 Tax=Gordonia sp. QH-12 TaxID=1437876 RepID=UPI0012E889C8|nr:hypothetical protein [Gordonia sp. QH-12]